MSLLRNVLTYMGLGPDEDYDDGYLRDRGESRRTGAGGTETDAADAPGADGRGATRRGESRRSGDDSRLARIELDDPAGAFFDDPHAPRDRPEWLKAEAANQVVPGEAAGRDDRAGRGAPTGRRDRMRRSTVGPPANTGGGVPVDVDEVAGGDAGADADSGATQTPETEGRALEDRRAGLRKPGGPSRPLRAVPPAELGIQTDLVQPENGLTVRSVPVMEAEMGPESSAAGAAPHARRQAMPRILSPETFGDAKLLADDFKRSVPVVLNLQQVDRDLARRLIDFASGICYALDGSMEKLATQVFLLSPPGIDVAEVDRRRMHQRGYES